MKNNIYNFYKKKYDLKKLDVKISNKKILFLIYRKKNYFLLDESFLETDNVSDILKEIDDLNKSYNLKISFFYPVCFCNDTLVIAFRTKKVENHLLRSVNYHKVDDKYNVLIDYHRLNYCSPLISLNVRTEISMSQKYINRYKFHEKFIKKYFLTDKRKKKDEYYKMLLNLIPKSKSIIDVSCGSNSDVFKVAKEKKYKLIVGNDICLNYLNLNNEDGVVYTNDDIEFNDIKSNSYNVSFCKNTMHHMNDVNRINILLSFLNKISNTIIIVEIKDPREDGGMPEFLNKYLYTKFLKDVGTCYLNKEEFTEIIDKNFTNHKIEYSEFKNILGTYMIAKIVRLDGYEDES